MLAVTLAVTMIRARIVALLLAVLVVQVEGDDSHRGLVPFNLVSAEGTCLDVRGSFGPCDVESSLFVYVPRTAGKRSEGHSLVAVQKPADDTLDGSCLARVSPFKAASGLTSSKCNARGAKGWQLAVDRSTGKYFLSANEQKSCVVRTAHSSEGQNFKAAVRKKKKDDFDQRYLFNGGMVQSCKDGGSALQIVESSFHDVGFWLRAADGACFDGVGFRTCAPSVGALVWGWGFRCTRNGQIERFLYKWHDSDSCLQRGSRRGGVNLGSCGSMSAWELSGGRLSSEGQCIARSLSSTAALVKCKGNQFEHLRMELSARTSLSLDASASGRR